MQLHLSVRPTKQKGAFLVIATILLLVLSSLGVALMSMAISASRTSRNYSDYVTAHIRAISMAGYAQRIIESFTEGQYPGPGTCNDSASCNQIDSTFPRNGRPILPWDVGTMTATMFKGSENNTWWNTNGFEYESTFAGSGDARVVVSLLNSSTVFPNYTNTYKIVGYSTDNNGVAPATAELYTTWNGFRPDPGDGSTCAGSCSYGQCCSAANACSSDQTDCEGGTAAFVPSGWYCDDYFVTGLGYNASTCANPNARISDAMLHFYPTQKAVMDSYTTNSSPPTSFTFEGSTITSFDQGGSSNVIITGDAYSINHMGYNTQTGVEYFYIQYYLTNTYMGYTANPGQSFTGYNVVRTATYIDSSGNYVFICGLQIPGGDNNDIPAAYLPAYCTCDDMASAWTGGGSCISY